MSLRSTSLFVLAVAVLIGTAVRSNSLPMAVPEPTPGTASWLAVERVATGKLAPVGQSQLQRISITAKGLGWAPGSQRRMWRSGNGGSEWQAGTMDAVIALGAALRDDSLGLLALGNGRIARSTDLGSTWKIVRPPANGARVFQLTWIDASTALAVGEGVILRSTDAGLTWPPLKGYARDYHDVAFRGGIGLVVGGGGTVLRSTDGGVTWTLHQQPTSNVLHGVAFADAGTVVAVGSNGTILRSTDGGVTWTPAASQTTRHLRAVAFADAHAGVAVGFYGTILITRDAGASWQPVPSGTNAHLLGVAIDPQGAPIAVGYFDTMLKGPKLRDVAVTR